MVATARTTAPHELDWDRLSRHYPRQHWLERPAVRMAAEMLDPPPAARVLDVATGTGELLRALKRRPAPPRRVVGVDSSAAMLARVPPLPSGWSVRKADARCLPFPDASFDAAGAAYLFHVLGESEIACVLSELARVLRPGGRLVTITPAIPPDGPARPLAVALHRVSRRRSRYAALRAMDPRSALGAAGFEMLAAQRVHRGYPSICVLASRPQ